MRRLLLLAILIAGCAGVRTPRIVGSDADKPRVDVVLEPLHAGGEPLRVGGLPTDLAPLPEPDRRVLLVALKAGEVVGVDLDTGDVATVATVAGVDAGYVEDGLLGIALHPSDPRRLFVSATVSEPRRTVVRELSLEGAYPALSVRRRATLLEFPRTRRGHNGGQLRFGPDGALYAAFGDGGGQRDPDAQGHDPSTWSGTIARIALDGTAPTVHAHGLRNPWRFDVDASGRMLVADVGQDRWEEIHLVEAGDHLGWSLRDGPECFADRRAECEAACAAGEELVDPVYAYPRADGAALIGGVFARGGPLRGRFLFGDNVSGRLWALELPHGAVAPRGCPVEDDPVPSAAPGVVVSALGAFGLPFSTFGHGPDGDVLVAETGGRVFRVRSR